MNTNVRRLGQWSPDDLDLHRSRQSAPPPGERHQTRNARQKGKLRFGLRNLVNGYPARAHSRDCGVEIDPITIDREPMRGTETRFVERVEKGERTAHGIPLDAPEVR